MVYAKMSADGTEAHLRVCCVTDDRVDKTLENQTGYVEVARSCDVEVRDKAEIDREKSDWLFLVYYHTFVKFSIKVFKKIITDLFQTCSGLVFLLKMI